MDFGFVHDPSAQENREPVGQQDRMRIDRFTFPPLATRGQHLDRKVQVGSAFRSVSARADVAYDVSLPDGITFPQ